MVVVSSADIIGRYVLAVFVNHKLSIMVSLIVQRNNCTLAGNRHPLYRNPFIAIKPDRILVKIREGGRCVSTKLCKSGFKYYFYSCIYYFIYFQRRSNRFPFSVDGFTFVGDLSIYGVIM